MFLMRYCAATRAGSLPANPRWGPESRSLPVVSKVTRLQGFYRRKVRLLPDKIDIALGGVWRDAINGYDR